MANVVTVEELAEWIKKNQHRTWNWGGKTSYDKLTLEMKYIRFNLDTRDMKIFAITTDGTRGVTADFREDDKDWTILDLLESRLDERKK